MDIRISTSSTDAHQADESSESTDDGNFAGRLADLTLQGNLSPGGACEKMGLCCSRPHTSDAHIPTPSSVSLTPPSSSPGSSPSLRKGRSFPFSNTGLPDCVARM